MLPPRITLRLLLALIACVATALALAACGGGDESGSGTERTADAPSAGAPAGDDGDGPVPLRIAADAWAADGPWVIAKARGFDRTNGLEIQLVDAVPEDKLVAAVASGRIDAARVSLATALRHMGADDGLRAVLVQDSLLRAEGVVARRPAYSIADLRGRAVGIEAGGNGLLLLAKALEEKGMTLDDVKLVDLPAGGAGAALRARRVAAAATREPQLGRLWTDHTMVAHAKDWPGLAAEVWEVSDRFADAHPEAVAGALRAWDAGLRYVRANEDRSIMFLANMTGASPSTLLVAFDGIELYDTRESLAFVRGPFAARAREAVAFEQQAGALDADADADELIDVSSLEAAAGR